MPSVRDVPTAHPSSASSKSRYHDPIVERIPQNQRPILIHIHRAAFGITVSTRIFRIHSRQAALPGESPRLDSVNSDE